MAKLTAETTGRTATRRHARWDKPQGLGWPESTPATSLAAAKARASSGSLQQGDLRSVLSCYGIYASSWSFWCSREDELDIGGLPATSGSGGPRRAPVKLGLEEGIDGESLGEMTACSRGVQWWR